MSPTVVEKAVCENCGVDVRENTLFCYNCGSQVAKPEPVAPEPDSAAETETESKAALDNLAERLKIEPPSESEQKRARAAAERKKARINPRKRREIVWEPAEKSPERFLLLISLLIAIIAGVIVVMTVL